MNKKTLVSLMVISLIVIGTVKLAYAIEDMDGLDLIIDINGVIYNPLNRPIFNVDDIKPGYSGEETISLHVNEDACGFVYVNLTSDKENGCIEPEIEAEPDCENDNIGELNDHLNFFVWNDEGDLEGWQCGNTPKCLFDLKEGNNIKDGTRENILFQGTLIGNKSWDIGKIPASIVYYYGIAWNLPKEIGNIVQSDSFSADLIFKVEQIIPPIIIKTVGDPKIKCEVGDWCDWKITMTTPTTLSCEIGNVKWRYALDGDWKEWNTSELPVTIYFPEESNHTLEAKCVSLCGESETDIEKFKVEGKSFRISLYRKWNLISVPFVMLDDSIDEVFKDIKQDVTSVWTYDPEHAICGKDWCLYVPNNEINEIDEMVPGSGYWVLANKNTLLEIGGSLFSPAATLPEKKVVHGWNLIGYYGTEGQTIYNGPVGSGKTAYCELYSLVDTTVGNPRWSSLVTYWEPDNPNQWKYLGTWDNMDPGAGYWLEIDVNDIYAPATICV
jgi:hypothetical protein